MFLLRTNFMFPAILKICFMGWKAFSVLIKPARTISDEELLQVLGFTNCTKIDDEPYEMAIYPNDGKVFICNYGDTLIISEFDLPEQFFTEGLCVTEKKLAATFPHAEICAVSLHSATNYWAYAIIRDDKKVRVRAGSADSGIMLDYGEPLEEELDLLSKAKLDENGKRLYFFDGDVDSSYTEDQVGENFVFELYKRYTGEALDRNDELFNTNCRGYQFEQPAKAPRQFKSRLASIETKPWWKFW